MKIAQLGLGHFERYAETGDEQQLGVARAVADHLLTTQTRERGPHLGGWRHTFPYVYRTPMRPPWLSAMSQGQAASLLTRLATETGDERYTEAAALALESMNVPVRAGGVLGDLDGMPFLEEYPTVPESHVLNGAIFALWGIRDVALSTGDASTEATHREFVAAFRKTCHRWDTGRWSSYDLYPHRPRNIASSFYHQLHISQLRTLDTLYGGTEFGMLAERFEGYQARAVLGGIAFVQKVFFRIAIPRPKIPSDISTVPPRFRLRIPCPYPIRRS